MKSVDRLKKTLEDFVSESETSRGIIRRSMENGPSAEYRLRWMEGSYKDVYLGLLAQQVLDNIDNLKDVAEVIERQLSDWRPELSSSAFNNACNLERFNALRVMVETLRTARRAIAIENMPR